MEKCRNSSDCKNADNWHNAIRANLKEITEKLSPNVDTFLDFLQKVTVINTSEREIVDNKTTKPQKLLVLLDLVEGKDEFWDSLITYLKSNGYKILARKLESLPAQINDSPASIPIDEFKIKLTNHYTADYSRVPTVFGHSKPIEDVWVPLRIKDDTNFPVILKKPVGFDHVELLKRLEDPKNPHVVLVKGHPGVGKTTLVKKIAYDWANGNLDHYFLVLAVPLRHVDSAEDVLQMAVDYYARVFRLSSAARNDLFKTLMQLDRKLLICFDGLDEYSKFAESPFIMLFGSQFETSETTYIPSTPLALSCQLLITSRPYACHRIKQDFCPLRFEICPLENHLGEPNTKLLTHSHVALVTGQPGMSKTTLIKKIAYDWASNKSSQNGHFILILVLPLRDVDSAKDFLQMAVDYYALKLRLTPFGSIELNNNFYPLQFDISPLRESHLDEFVMAHCVTEHGVKKVINYFQANANLVIKVPLILTFVCFLSETNVKIPTNLTLLYDRLLCLMIRREHEGMKLAEEISIDSWRNCNFLKSTLQLAFEGCRDKKFEFPEPVQKAVGVSKDSFTCGILLSKFDFDVLCLTAEFPHRSIQEFFAAAHCYQLILTAVNTKRNFIMKEILNKDSQFGRFFFGICSQEKKFEEMLEWLNLTFDDAEIIQFNVSRFLSLLSASLSDCSEYDAKLLGQRLAASLDKLEKKIKQTERNLQIILRGEDLSPLNKSFQSGLNLNFLDDNEVKYSWSLSHVRKPKLSGLTYVKDLPVNLWEKFNKIQIFMWTGSDLGDIISSLDRLPPVSTLIVTTGNINFEVNFDINYKMTTTSGSGQLRHFTCAIDRNETPWWLTGQPDSNDVIIEETRETGKYELGTAITWLTVTISRSLDQSQLVRTLIQLALRIPYKPLESIREAKKETSGRKKKKCGLM